MSVAKMISLEEYLHTSYSPDREYRDGVLVERNVGDKPSCTSASSQETVEYTGLFRTANPNSGEAISDS
jgi:hypothetical protein